MSNTTVNMEKDSIDHDKDDDNSIDLNYDPVYKDDKDYLDDLNALITLDYVIYDNRPICQLCKASFFHTYTATEQIRNAVNQCKYLTNSNIVTVRWSDYCTFCDVVQSSSSSSSKRNYIEKEECIVYIPFKLRELPCICLSQNPWIDVGNNNDIHKSNDEKAYKLPNGLFHQTEEQRIAEQEYTEQFIHDNHSKNENKLRQRSIMEFYHKK